jgi:hypothetical protein
MFSDQYFVHIYNLSKDSSADVKNNKGYEEIIHSLIWGMHFGSYFQKKSGVI